MKKSHFSNWTVAITGMNARPDNPGPGYAVARCLREAPAFRGRIIGCGYDVLDPGLYAHDLCSAGYLLPYPSAGEEVLFERLLEIHRREQIDVFIPCLDAELPSFIRLQPRLALHGIRMLLPKAASVRQRDKERLPELCRQANLHHPRTQKVTDRGFFVKCREQGWSYPMVVKGPFYDAAVCDGEVQAACAFTYLANQWGYPILAQEFIPGQELNLTAIGDGRGRLLGTVMMAKRALTDKGKAWAGVTIIDEELEQMAGKLVQELGWRGPLEVEALRGHDGRLYLLEINPRFPAWVYLSKGVGRNLPLQLLRLLAGETTFIFPAQPAGRMFIRYAKELVVDIESFEKLMMQGVLPFDNDAIVA